MNLNFLMDLFFLHEKRSFNKNYDSISDFKKLLHSSLPLEYTLSTIQEDVIPTLNKIHEDQVLIDVKFFYDGIRVYKNKMLLLKKEGKHIKYEVVRFLKSVIEENTKNSIPIFNFEENEFCNIENIEDAISHAYKDLVVVQIRKIDMFRNTSSSGNMIQYFYEKNNKFYCAYLNIIPNEILKKFSDDPVLYYFSKRINIDLCEESIFTYSQYENFFKHSPNIKEYLCYIFKTIFDNSYTSTYFKDNFTRIESNDFIACLEFFKGTDEYSHIFKEYYNTISSEEEKKRLLVASSSFCMCPRSERSFFNMCSKQNEGDDLPETCRFINKLMYPDNDKVCIQNPYAKNLQSFFIYLYANHIDTIMKYKEDFLKIMNYKIYRSLNFIFEHLKKKIFLIINFYNIQEQKIRNEHFDKLNEILKDKLSHEEVKVVINRLSK